MAFALANVTGLRIVHARGWGGVGADFFHQMTRDGRALYEGGVGAFPRGSFHGQIDTTLVVTLLEAAIAPSRLGRRQCAMSDVPTTTLVILFTSGGEVEFDAHCPSHGPFAARVDSVFGLIAWERVGVPPN
jgi:hypothetical protein